jgi:hypothetical protein
MENILRTSRSHKGTEIGDPRKLITEWKLLALNLLHAQITPPKIAPPITLLPTGSFQMIITLCFILVSRSEYLYRNRRLQSDNNKLGQFVKAILERLSRREIYLALGKGEFYLVIIKDPEITTDVGVADDELFPANPYPPEWRCVGYWNGFSGRSSEHGQESFGERKEGVLYKDSLVEMTEQATVEQK